MTQCWLIVEDPRYSNRIAQSLWNLLCFLSVLPHFKIRSHASEASRRLMARLLPNSVYSKSGLCSTFLAMLYTISCYIVPCWKYLWYTNFAVQSVCLAKHSPCKLDLRVINRRCMQNHRPQNDRSGIQSTLSNVAALDFAMYYLLLKPLFEWSGIFLNPLFFNICIDEHVLWKIFVIYHKKWRLSCYIVPYQRLG